MAKVNRGALRQLALERANFKCEFPGCGMSVQGELEMAHLKGSGMGGSKHRDHIDNVAILCRHHHDWLDGRTTSMRRFDDEQVLRGALDRTWTARQ